MKKIFTIFTALTFCSLSHGQITMGLGAGYSARHQMPTAEVSAGAILKETFVIEGTIQTHLSRKAEAGAQLQWRMGVQLNRYGNVIFTPFSGMSYHLKSTDNKALNETKPLFGLEAAIPFKYESGRAYAAGTVSGKTYIVSVGVKYLFIKN